LIETSAETVIKISQEGIDTNKSPSGQEDAEEYLGETAIKISHEVGYDSQKSTSDKEVVGEVLQLIDYVEETASKISNEGNDSHNIASARENVERALPSVESTAETALEMSQREISGQVDIHLGMGKTEVDKYKGIGKIESISDKGPPSGNCNEGDESREGFPTYKGASGLENVEEVIPLIETSAETVIKISQEGIDTNKSPSGQEDAEEYLGETAIKISHEVGYDSQKSTSDKEVVGEVLQLIDYVEETASKISNEGNDSHNIASARENVERALPSVESTAETALEMSQREISGEVDMHMGMGKTGSSSDEDLESDNDSKGSESREGIDNQKSISGKEDDKEVLPLMDPEVDIAIKSPQEEILGEVGIYKGIEKVESISDKGPRSGNYNKGDESREGFHTIKSKSGPLMEYLEETATKISQEEGNGSLKRASAREDVDEVLPLVDSAAKEAFEISQKEILGDVDIHMDIGKTGSNSDDGQEGSFQRAEFKFALGEGLQKGANAEKRESAEDISSPKNSSIKKDSPKETDAESLKKSVNRF